MITQERLKELLHYCPDTGIFTWIKARQGISLWSDAGCTIGSGYRVITIDQKLHKSHRLAFLYMTGIMPAETVDHIDHDRANNIWRNLRQVTQEKNMRNMTIKKNNTSGFTGVSWSKKKSRWVSLIRGDNKMIYLGSFENIEDAIVARKTANIKYGYHENHGTKINTKILL